MAVKFITENKLLYEVDEKGEKVLVRSTESSSRAYLRFSNKTSRPVDVWWRDFRGTRHHYICLGPGAYVDINTYVTHPWEFTDPATAENFVINNSIVYRAAPKLGGMLFRTNWNITVQVRSLKQCAMLAVARQIPFSNRVRHLGLPKTLEAEVQQLVKDIQVEVDPETAEEFPS